MTVPLRTIVRPGDPPIEPLKKTETGPPEPVVYFAYGSNMSTARLRKRMPSCEALGIATLPGYALRFHKRSRDKSAKCNAFASGNNTVIGVLFSFDPAERAKLDEAEGVGAVMSAQRSQSSTRKVAGGRPSSISPLPTTLTTASSPMSGTKTLSSLVRGSTDCRRSILQTISSRLRRPTIPNKTRDNKRRATPESLGREATV